MAYRHGDRVGDELWMRCPFCGDTPNSPTRCHFSVRQDGRYHCFRCGVGGKMGPQEIETFWPFAERTAQAPPDTSSQAMYDLVDSMATPGPGSSRRTLLDRRHVTLGETIFDVFESRDPKGRRVGLHLRSTQPKVARTLGKRAFGYQGRHLLSLMGKLRVVEGPYDVLYPSDVCTFGFVTPAQLKALVSYPLVLCPDGDVWDSEKRFYGYFQRFLDSRDAFLVGVEYLPPDTDPSDCTEEDRPLIEWHLIREYLTQAKSFVEFIDRVDTKVHPD